MQRQIQSVLLSRLKTWRSVALLGSRQVGKSYLLSEILKAHPGTLISFDDPLERQEAAGDPVRYLEDRYRPGKYLFIDEAARVPDIFSAVKIIVDKHDPTPTGICLANSGNYLLLRKVKESLAGRVSLLSIFPLSWQELLHADKKPGLITLIRNGIPKKVETPPSFTDIKRSREERMLWGGFPTPSLNDDKDARILWMQDYIRTYVLPLVVEQFNIRDTLAFERAARFLMLENTHFFNANKLAQNIGISQPTARDYIHYLEAMMVIRRVPIFFKSLIKRLIKQPKIYVSDQLLVNVCLGFNFSVQTAIERGIIGPIYESFIFNEVEKTLVNYDVFAQVYSWRTQDKAEVDIVLSTGAGILPLEIKWSSKIAPKDTTGLRSFLATYPEAKEGYVIYPGKTIQKIADRIFAIPDWWLLGCY